MSDIKFACPHCHQHIVCDSDYAELPIECPACGGTMAIPQLTAASAAADALVLVASPTLPAPRPTATRPPIDMLNEQRWAERLSADSETRPGLAALWFATLIGTLTLSFVFLTDGSGLWSVITTLIVGGGLTGFARGCAEHRSVPKAIVSGILFAIALAVLLPVTLLGILFVGCTACAQ